MNVATRQRIERAIVTRAVKTMLKAGALVSVHDGEEYVLERSDNLRSILSVMFSTDQDRLHFHKADDASDTLSYGWIYFVYGNDGWDVISDYTINLDSIFADTFELASNYETKFA